MLETASVATTLAAQPVSQAREGEGDEDDSQSGQEEQRRDRQHRQQEPVQQREDACRRQDSRCSAAHPASAAAAP